MEIKKKNLEDICKNLKVATVGLSLFLCSCGGGGGGGGSSSSTNTGSDVSVNDISLPQCLSIENLVSSLNFDIKSNILNYSVFPYVIIQSNSNEVGTIGYMVTDSESRPVYEGVLAPKLIRDDLLIFETNSGTFADSNNLLNGDYNIIFYPIQNDSVCISNSDGSIYEGNSKSVSFFIDR